MWTDKSITNIATRFDYLKYKIRQTTKQYCKTKSQNQKLKERELLHNIERLEDRQQLSDLTRDEKELLENSRLELEHILEYKARGFWVRSRISEIEQNEKSNAFFYSIAKEQHAKKTIHKIKKHNFHILDQKAILCL